MEWYSIKYTLIDNPNKTYTWQDMQGRDEWEAWLHFRNIMMKKLGFIRSDFKVVKIDMVGR